VPEQGQVLMFTRRACLANKVDIKASERGAFAHSRVGLLTISVVSTEWPLAMTWSARIGRDVHLVDRTHKLLRGSAKRPLWARIMTAGVSDVHGVHIVMPSYRTAHTDLAQGICIGARRKTFHRLGLIMASTKPLRRLERRPWSRVLGRTRIPRFELIP